MYKYPEKKSIVDSFRFYIMLGIMMKDENPISIKNFTLQLKNNNFTKSQIQYYIHQAAVTLPSEFLSIMELQSVDYKERKTFIGKENY